MELIYDVGVENGDDSAYYLHRGYRVVGIEASPIAAEKLRERFASEIDEGRYTLLPIGIAEHDGEAPFWVCDDLPQWSSFHRSIASRNGARHHPVTVETRTFRSVLEQFGRAAYCKVDVEGNDNLCVAALTPDNRPAYVSVELIDGAEQLSLLRAAGYGQFKVISQRSFRQSPSNLIDLKLKLPRIVRRAFNGVETRLLRHQPDRDWRFRDGCSGPFGEATHGDWQSFDSALRTCGMLARFGRHGSDWHDIHARL